MTDNAPIDPSDLAAFLSAKLCHDLIAPMAAIGNALEMLDDPTAASMHDDARELLNGSALSAWSKLEIFRVAFGSGGSAPGLIEVSELRGLVTKRFNDGKFSFDWRVRAEAMGKQAARVLLNLVIMTVDSLPRGGEIVIEIGAQGETIRVAGEGRMRRVSDYVTPALAGKSPEGGFDAQNIQPYYAGLLARRAGGRAYVDLSGEGVVFGAELKSVDKPLTPAI